MNQRKAKLTYGMLSAQSYKLSAQAPKNLWKRVQLSYGMWSVMVQLLEPGELVILQAMNRYFYIIGVPRINSKLALKYSIRRGLGFVEHTSGLSMGA